jgi:nitrogen fixation NifU-like protein
MNRQEAIEFLVDHFQNPQHRGMLPNATLTRSGGNPGCSDMVQMSMRITPDGQLDEVAFDGHGCTISMAAADYVAEIAAGKTLVEIEQMSADELIEDLGREIVTTRPTCATLALSILKQATHEYVMQQKLAGERQG